MTPADSAPIPSAGTWDACAFEAATLLEGTQVRAIPVGPPVEWPSGVAFLDGIQRTELLGYADTYPLCVAEVAAAVRIREGRELHTVVELRRTLLIGRKARVEAIQEDVPGVEVIALPDDPLVPPLRDIALAAQAVDSARSGLEAAARNAFRRLHPDTWLLVDGTLAAHRGWLGDAHAVGICRNHLKLPFVGDDLREYLHLPAGHRSPVFAPPDIGDVSWCAWGVRLRPWEGKDLLYGLVRVEVAAVNGTTEQADQVSRWLLAERAPVAGMEPQRDTLLYPFHSVRQYLQART